MDEGSTSKHTDAQLHHLAFRAMNCDMAAWVVADDPQEAKEHLSAVRDFMHQFEARLSRFRPESELSRLNARSAQVVPVSDWLWEVLDAALDGARRSGGLFDPTILDALEAAAVEEADTVARVADALARLDRSAALATVAASRGWVRPVVDDSLAFDIVGGRHPVVEEARRSAGEAFVPNDCRLEGEARVWLLTGPNMGGKSTFLRQNALIALLAQAGSFVPATSARLGLVDRLFSRVGASDNLAQGRSTFMVEMVETAAILREATPRSLLLLDEVGRGTATWDGLALAWAILEALHDRGSRTLFATHYHELTALRNRLAALALRTLRVKEWNGALLFLHEVGAGAAPGSFGLEVARLAGVPDAVLARARAILARLEAGEAGAGAVAALEDLPLFAAPPAASPPGPADTGALRARLAAIEPDSLTPRDALDLVYELVREARSGAG